MENFQLFGMSRSGHHAIINWIAGHYDGDVRHYNNCQFSELPGYQPTPHPGLLCNNIGNEVLAHGNGPRHCTIYSFEEQLTPVNIPSTNILCIRDPYNLFASRTHKQRQIDGRSLIFYSDVLLWKLFAKEFHGEAVLSRATIKINYNRWFTSRSYREKLAPHFGTHTDKNLDKVAEQWDGSSFDGTHFQGKAQQMRVLDRWKHYGADPEFLAKVVNDPEVKSLAGFIFGPFPYEPALI